MKYLLRPMSPGFAYKLLTTVAIFATLEGCNSASLVGGNEKITAPPPSVEQPTPEPRQSPTDKPKKDKPHGSVVSQPDAPATTDNRPSPDTVVPSHTETPSLPDEVYNDQASTTPPPNNTQNEPPTNTTTTEPPVTDIPPNPPSTAAGRALVPIEGYTNMEQGFHITDEDVFQLVRDGQVIAAGHATADALLDGTASNSSRGMAPTFVMNFELTYVSKDLSVGQGSGSLNLCFGGLDVKPETAKCQNERNSIGGELDRPSALINQPASWSISRGTDGKPQIAINESFAASREHPVYNFAAPGTSFKDYQSPLVIDLTGTGALNLVDVWDDTPGVRFDLMSAGHPMRTGWIGAGAGLLALDINGNGLIDDGRELLGESSHPLLPVAYGLRTFANGFAALAQYDSNRDGVINARDAIYNRLIVWEDRNADGVTQPNEVQHLSGLGLASIDLAYAAPRRAPPYIAASNQVRLSSACHTATGKDLLIADVWFQQRPNAKPAQTAAK